MVPTKARNIIKSLKYFQMEFAIGPFWGGRPLKGVREIMHNFEINKYSFSHLSVNFRINYLNMAIYQNMLLNMNMKY